MCSKNNILFITGYFPVQQGGAEYQALFLAERLKLYKNINFIFRTTAYQKKHLNKTASLFGQ